MPDLNRIMLYVRDVAESPDAILPILAGLLVAFGFWAIFGLRKVDKALAAKWSITLDQLAALQGAASGVPYRLLNLAYATALGAALLWVPCLFLVPQTHELPILGPWPMGCVTITMVSLGASMVFFTRSSFYSTALTRALSQHTPAEGLTAAGIAAGIDRHTIAKSAWQFRLMGGMLMLLPAAWALKPILGQILNGQ